MATQYVFLPQQFDGANPAVSYLGTPVIMAIELLGGRELIANNEYREYDGIILRSAQIEIDLTKNIVKTAVQGRNGTYKEYISDGDYIISIKGQLLNEEGNSLPPYDKIEALHNICKVSDSIKVDNALMRELGIFEIVIENFKISPPKGNMIEFSISAISEIPLIIRGE